MNDILSKINKPTVNQCMDAIRGTEEGGYADSVLSEEEYAEMVNWWCTTNDLTSVPTILSIAIYNCTMGFEQTDEIPY